MHMNLGWCPYLRPALPSTTAGKRMASRRIAIASHRTASGRWHLRIAPVCALGTSACKLGASQDIAIFIEIRGAAHTRGRTSAIRRIWRYLLVYWRFAQRPRESRNTQAGQCAHTGDAWGSRNLYAHLGRYRYWRPRQHAVCFPDAIYLSTASNNPPCSSLTTARWGRVELLGVNLLAC